MKVFEWIPNKSIGDLSFNMTKEETRRVMRDSACTHFNRRSDYYTDYSIRLDFDDHGLLEAVEFLGIERGFFQVLYNGRVVYPKTANTFFKIFDMSMFKQDPDDLKSFQCNKLNIVGTWNYDHGPALLVGREHYLDESDESLIVHDILDDLSFKLKPGMPRDETRMILNEMSDKLEVWGQADVYARYLIVKFDNADRMISFDCHLR